MGGYSSRALEPPAVFHAVALWHCGAVALGLLVQRCGAVAARSALWRCDLLVQRCGAVALWDSRVLYNMHLLCCGLLRLPVQCCGAVAARSALWRCGCSFSAVALDLLVQRCGAVALWLAL